MNAPRQVYGRYETSLVLDTFVIVTVINTYVHNIVIVLFVNGIINTP